MAYIDDVNEAMRLLGAYKDIREVTVTQGSVLIKYEDGDHDFRWIIAKGS